MNRRGFFSSLGVVCGSLIFPRKTEGVQSKGLSHEEMAQLLIDHSHNVCLEGDDFGRTRNIHYADETDFEGNQIHLTDHDGEWRVTGNSIGLYQCRRSVIGSLVEVRYYDRSPPNRLCREERFEISNPLLKVIHFVGDPVWQKKDRLVPRHFARIGERWMEIT